jgi:hypothetical protein
MGPNFRGDNIYEFIFSDTLEVFGENWESKPANGYPLPPDMEYIKKVGTLVNEDIVFELVQDSDELNFLLRNLKKKTKNKLKLKLQFTTQQILNKRKN